MIFDSTPIVAGNWKMNKTDSETIALIKSLKEDLENVQALSIIFPPFISLLTANKELQNSTIKLGAQNMHFEESGQFTGEISAKMLVNICEYVIIGHSERRQFFNESNTVINKKLKSAIKNGLKPILCIGESLEEKSAGLSAKILEKQLIKGLDGITNSKDLIIAYEPVWAIGTGEAANPEEISLTIKNTIHTTLASINLNHPIIPILYGGSVNPSNTASFMNYSEINGVLVGSASLKDKDFIEIAKIASQS